MSRGARRAEPHVRLYRHELECPAYRSLSTDARALLVEMRALYRGQENRIFMSRREIEKRLGIGRWCAEKARDELLDRGFIRLVEPGGFNRKVPHAPTYVLTNEPDNPLKDGAVAKKDFMSWTPTEKKSTGSVTNRAGAGDRPRPSTRKLESELYGAGDRPRKVRLRGAHGAGDQPTDKLPGSTGASGVLALMGAAMAMTDETLQFRLCCAAVLLQSPMDAVR